MSDSKDWKVERKAKAYVEWRTVYKGVEDVARRRYEKIDLELRQGAVRLLDPSGNEIAKGSGPMTRTRW